ncbi:hypothetical protein CAS74_002527 [Pichia kudriavzevii]|uniref:Tyrosine specific protein phosphatases domain-containing protein n=2 Tax=Pichia kudriavzevii TaxID=4909 RepID=A0A1Z8JQT4_PICKU|nr:hypothetical protein CAS74_002527 [Pichia kudriavzevii]
MTKRLTVSRLKELQERDSSHHVSLRESLWKYLNDDMHTDFEKEILALKPNDCLIVQKYTSVQSFPIENRPHLKEVSVATLYSEHPLREFHKRILKGTSELDQKKLVIVKEQLLKIDTLPVLVFIHGLGGQMSQFEPILQELRNCSDMFAIDLPGFGNSKRPSRNDPSKTLKFSSLSEYSKDDLLRIEKCLDDMRDEDFQTDQLVDMLYQILMYRFPSRKFIFLSHSMGTHISIKLVNRLSEGKVESVVMLAPPAIHQPHEHPSLIKRMGLNRRMFLDLFWYMPGLFDYFRVFDRKNGLYSKSVESYIYCGQSEEDDILKRLTQLRWNLDTDSKVFLKYLFGFHCASENELKKMCLRLNSRRMFLCCGEEDQTTPIKYSLHIRDMIEGFAEDGVNIRVDFESITHANHSIFLDKPNLLAGSIYHFIESLHLNISCTWVLQVKALISGDKWGLKNEEKWNKVVTISKPMTNKTSPEKPRSFLIAMKTLRQTDAVHNPKRFESDHPEVFAIIDIGSDTPSYDPNDFVRIKYVKYKTESKVTPDNITIVKFLEIVDKLLEERANAGQFVAVHCHYGQNRTGFLICCYLIEKLGWSVAESIEAFEISKPPGIKHVHFRNALYLRYES